MKRRGFLSLLGAATTAPLLPTLPASASAGYSRTLFSRAVAVTRMKPHVSARGIAALLRIPASQAERMLTEMTARGIVVPVPGGAGVHVRASNAIVRAAGMRAAAQQSQRPKAPSNTPDTLQPSPLMTYLHTLCTNYGLTLSPRCAMSEAAFA